MTKKNQMYFAANPDAKHDEHLVDYHIDDIDLTSNQQDATNYWGVSERFKMPSPMNGWSKWPYPSISSSGSIQIAGHETVPMIYY